MSATSETLSIFIFQGKFQMVDFYQNAPNGENSIFPNVFPLYTVGKEILYWTTFAIEFYPEILSWDVSPDVEREFLVLKRNRYSNCFLSFCWNIHFFNFEEILIKKTFKCKCNKILQIHLGASLKPRIHSFRRWSIHTERGE